MSEIRDNFCKTLDHSDLGVTGTMQKFSNLLRETDYEVWEHLVNILIHFHPLLLVITF